MLICPLPRPDPRGAAPRPPALGGAVELEVDEIGSSLRYAAATITKQPCSADGSTGTGDRASAADGSDVDNAYYQDEAPG